MKRKEGYYWVKYCGEWIVAEYRIVKELDNPSRWKIPQLSYLMPSDALDEIDERRIERFAEANAKQNLLCDGRRLCEANA